MSGLVELSLMPAYPFYRLPHGDVVLDLEVVLDCSGDEDDLLLRGEILESLREEERGEIWRLGRMTE